jgi:dienelactone hydrolase
MLVSAATMVSSAFTRHAAAIFALCAATLAADSTGAAERILIKDGGITLRAMLYRPAAGKEPAPAVVALHGCGGLWTKSGRITERFDEWGERLMKAGFAVVFPDSFGSRNQGSQCSNAKRDIHSSRERVADAIAARRWLQSQPWVKPDRVSLIGWSNGATTTLYTIREKGSQPQPAFHSAIALYPGCKTLQRLGWKSSVPTLLLLGGADDWTPAKPCQDMAAGAAGRKPEVVTYPGAYHGFDGTSPVRERKGLAFTGDNSGTAHAGTNEPARADAIKRVPQWLSQ